MSNVVSRFISKRLYYDGDFYNGGALRSLQTTLRPTLGNGCWCIRRTRLTFSSTESGSVVGRAPAPIAGWDGSISIPERAAMAPTVLPELEGGFAVTTRLGSTKRTVKQYDIIIACHKRGVAIKSQKMNHWIALRLMMLASTP
jgi:hypothetical protein